MREKALSLREVRDIKAGCHWQISVEVGLRQRLRNKSFSMLVKRQTGTSRRSFGSRQRSKTFQRMTFPQSGNSQTKVLAASPSASGVCFARSWRRSARWRARWSRSPFGLADLKLQPWYLQKYGFLDLCTTIKWR